jgi:hypothetical protein
MTKLTVSFRNFANSPEERLTNFLTNILFDQFDVLIASIVFNE